MGCSSSSSQQAFHAVVPSTSLQMLFWLLLCAGTIKTVKLGNWSVRGTAFYCDSVLINQVFHPVISVLLALRPQGFQETWDKNTTSLACIPNTATAPEWLPSVIAALSVFGSLLLLVAALLVWFRMAVQLRSKWQREKELNKHRQLGVPQGCLATIVVTDVEHYSGQYHVVCSGWVTDGIF